MDERQTLEWLCWKPMHPETLDLAGSPRPPRIALAMAGGWMVGMGVFVLTKVQAMLTLGATGLAAVFIGLSVSGIIAGLRWARLKMLPQRTPGRPWIALLLGMIAYGAAFVVLSVAPASVWRRVSHLVSFRQIDAARGQLGNPLRPELEQTLLDPEVQRLLHAEVNALSLLDEQVGKNIANNEPLDTGARELRQAATAASQAFAAAVAHRKPANTEYMSFTRFDHRRPWIVHPSWERLYGGGPKTWQLIPGWQADLAVAADRLARDKSPR